MTATQTQPKSWYSKAKLLAIPVLAIILAGVLYGNNTFQFGGPPGSPAVTPPHTRIVPRAPLATAETQPRVWPEIAFTEIIALDPFHSKPNSPAALAPQATNGSPTNLQENKAAEVSRLLADANPTKLSGSYTLRAICQSQGKAAAIVNDRIIHVGDLLPGGERVVELTRDGITVEGM